MLEYKSQLEREAADLAFGRRWWEEGVTQAGDPYPCRPGSMGAPCPGPWCLLGIACGTQVVRNTCVPKAVVATSSWPHWSHPWSAVSGFQDIHLCSEDHGQQATTGYCFLPWAFAFFLCYSNWAWR